jgi:hypothetical protein
MKMGFCGILQVFLIVCFVLAQVSPACAFVSGKMSLMEICAADGTVKTIKVAEQYDPSAKQGKAPIVAKDCAFCFAQAHLSKLPVHVGVISPVLPSSYISISSGMIVPVSYKFAQGQPRAPPVLS